MRMSQSYLRDQIALRGAHIHRGMIPAPRELTRDCQISPMADRGHCFQELPESRGLCVQRFKGARTSLAVLVLRLSGTQCSRKIAPERKEALIRHFEHAADVRRLALI